MAAESVSPAGSSSPQQFQKRRSLVGFFLGGGLFASAISFLYPILQYLIPPATADLGTGTVVAGTKNELRLNSGKIFRFGNKPGLLVRTADGQYRALSATCTHLDCTVQYRGDLHQVWCACHNGIYDLNGRNLSGPPPRPLERYEVQIRGEEIIVQRKGEG